MTTEEKKAAESPAAISEAGPVRYLEPGKVRFFRHGALLRVTIEDERTCIRASVLRAFPLSMPDRYLSLRDGAGKEMGIIRDPAGLDPDSRGLVAGELARRYLNPVVRRIISVKERFGIVEWEADTDRGVRRFATRNLRENLVKPSPHRYIIADVDDNRYDIRDLSAMDAQSQGWLIQYL
jgi:hypothetical protein